MAKKRNYSEKEVSDLISLFKEIQEDPSAYDRIKSQLKGNLLSDFVNMGTSLMDIGISSNQIKAANDAERSLKKPELTQLSRDDRRIKEALTDAQGSIYDTRAQLAPAELALMENYFNDLNNARVASGGQAGLYGAGAQAASLRNQRGALGLAAINDKIINNNKDRYNRLVDLDARNNQVFYNNSLAQDEMMLNDYYRHADANALLGSTGRANMRDSIYGAAGLIPNIYNNLDAIGRADYDGSSAYDDIDMFESSFMDRILNANGSYRRLDDYGQSSFRDY